MSIFIWIVILAAIFYFVYIKYGKLSFWRKAAKNPDFTYQQLLRDDAWIIDNGTSSFDKGKDELDGPFLLYVPGIGKTVKFYGKVGKYEDSQKRIGNEL